MISQTPRIAIIGAGLGGLALAISLHAHSIPCSVYESRPAPTADISDQISYFTPNGDGGYLALSPNALRCLNRLGIYEHVRDAGFNYDEVQLRSARNMGLIGRVRSYKDDKAGYQSTRVARGLVRRLLLDLAKENGVEMVFNKKFASLENAGSTQKVHFNDGSYAEACLVVGADGMHSEVREYVEAGAVPRFSGQVGIGAPMERKKLDGVLNGVQMPCMVIGKENAFAFMPCRSDGGEVAVFATIEMEDRSREEWNAFMEDREELKRMMTKRHGKGSEWPELVKKACEEIDTHQVVAWPTYKLPTLKQYVSDCRRVILLGDAAHGIPPHAGQGSAMAFEDALTLADAIVSGTDLVLWQRHRMSRIEQVLAFTTKSGAMRKASSSVFQQIIKEWAISAYLWWMGGETGMEWLCGYDTRSVSLSSVM